MAQVARDPELHENVLRKWIREQVVDPGSAFPGHHQTKPEQVEIERFRREVARLKAEPTSISEITEWFGRWPNANVGIVTGSISQLIVLDVDPAHGGNESLEKLERSHGMLPRTLEASTGGGGRHLYFRHPGVGVRNRVGIATGLDIRGDGGYVVAPPSIHPSGKPYIWLNDRVPSREMLALPPPWLLEPKSATAFTGHPLAYWRSLLRHGVSEGERNNTLAALTGRLLWHDLGPQMITELLLCWNAVRCRPPLPDSEVIATVGSIVRTHLRTKETQ